VAFATDHTNGLRDMGWPTCRPGGSVLQFGAEGKVMRNVSVGLVSNSRLCDGEDGVTGAIPPGMYQAPENPKYN
jgi:hypothetical protein